MRRIVTALAAAVIVTGVVGTATPAEAKTPQRLDFNTVPTAPWDVNGDVTASGGVLHVGPTSSVNVGFDPAQRGEWYSGVENELGWTFSARVRLDAALAHPCADEGAAVNLADHTLDVWLSFGTDGICVRTSGMSPIRHPMNTQRAFHTYRLDVKRQNIKLSVDGSVAVAFAAPRSPSSFIGAWIEIINIAGNRTHWDWLSYDTTPSLPACTIVGTSGNDVLYGTPGADVICGRVGHDIIYGRGGDDVLIGGFGDDQLYGGPGRDILLGNDGFDLLRGDEGADTMYGGAGGDTFRATAPAGTAAGGDGADLMIGGVDEDTVDYGRRSTSVRVTLDGLANDGSPGEGDRAGIIPWQSVIWPDIEAVTGGSGDDVIDGSIIPNFLVGGAGADTVRGLGGDDTIDVLDHAGGDTANGGEGDDLCVSDTGDTRISCER